MKAIREIANYLTGIQLKELNEKVLTSTRYCLLDALGCGLFGSTMPESKKIIVSLTDFYQTNGSPVWGTARRFAPDNAAFICSSFCHMRELDDVHYTILHPGAVCVPAGFAVAHKKRLNLGSLILSTLCGVETMVKIAKGINYIEHRRKGWHGTSTCGSFGAAASAGKILGLDEKGMANALAIAGSRTGGLWAFGADGAMSKRLHPGFASRDGVLSAYLASEGITGPMYILEAEDGGFYNATSTDWDLEKAVTTKDNIWAIEEMEYKWYASCKSVHSPLEAAQQIHFKYPEKKIEEISKVIVEVNNTAFKNAGKMYNTNSIASAQLSIQYAVALGLLGKNGGGEDYTIDCLKDDIIYCLASKVFVQPNNELDILRSKTNKNGAKVTIFWKDGKISQSMNDSPKGSLSHPLSHEDLENKFINLTLPVLGKEKTQLLKDTILHAPCSFPIVKISDLLIKK